MKNITKTQVVILIGLILVFGILIMFVNNKKPIAEIAKQEIRFPNYILSPDRNDYIELSEPKVSVKGDIAYLKGRDLYIYSKNRKFSQKIFEIEEESYLTVKLKALFKWSPDGSKIGVIGDFKRKSPTYLIYEQYDTEIKVLNAENGEIMYAIPISAENLPDYFPFEWNGNDEILFTEFNHSSGMNLYSYSLSNREKQFVSLIHNDFYLGLERYAVSEQKKLIKIYYDSKEDNYALTWGDFNNQQKVATLLRDDLYDIYLWPSPAGRYYLYKLSTNSNMEMSVGIFDTQTSKPIQLNKMFTIPELDDQKSSFKKLSQERDENDFRVEALEWSDDETLLFATVYRFIDVKTDEEKTIITAWEVQPSNKEIVRRESYTFISPTKDSFISGITIENGYVIFRYLFYPEPDLFRIGSVIYAFDTVLNKLDVIDFNWAQEFSKEEYEIKKQKVINERAELKKEGEENFLIREKARQEGKSTKQFALEKFLKNPMDYPSTTINNRLTYLLSYQVDWDSIREGIVAVIQDSKIVWEDVVSGIEGAKYVDINGDGIDEIEVNSDGGGNRPTCLNIYYRWTGKLYERVKFKNDNNYEAIDCGEDLVDINNDGVYEYKSLTWRHMYPETYLQYFIDLRDAPKEAFICEQVITTYRYDGENFTIVDEKVVEDNIDGREFMRTCIY